MIVESQSNGRQGAARNIGLGYSSADWVCFVDSDDWVEPDYLEILYAHTGLEPGIHGAPLEHKKVFRRYMSHRNTIDRRSMAFPSLQ